MPSLHANVLKRIVQVRDGEIRAMLWSGAYFFFLLSGYYILRPLREAMGLEGGVDNLPWLYTGTLTVMLVVNPVFSALVSRYPRRVFIPVVYRFFMLNLAVFFALFHLTPAGSRINIARVFFVWVSVFNLFAVSVFWGFMADLWQSGQAKRLFGFIGLGGTLGAILGGFTTAMLAESLGPVNLLLLSILLLECAVLAVRKLRSCFADRAEEPRAFQPNHGRGALGGIRLVLRSPYLLGICLYMFLFTIGSTLVYFAQAHIVNDAAPSLAERTSVFAFIDTGANLFTLLLQAFLTGRIITRFGVATALCILPVLTCVGFGVLAAAPVLWVLAAFQIARRGLNYAVARPGREILYTVLGRDEKYKAKNLIDTFVYRSGDAIGAWTSSLLTALGPGITALGVAGAPLAVGWMVVGWMLGRKQERLQLQRHHP
jgi:AAA family ATP:ADP antiporter